ncbi:MAG: lipoyl(octanoyl) transferase LipB [Gammaproteobacteria bacterium]
MARIPHPELRFRGRLEYEPAWREMQAFTNERGADTLDEIWFLEHPPVFTLGLNGKREHLLAPGDIPVIPIDRGGQVTYHGPGQLVIYPLLDLKRLGLSIRDLVGGLEQAVIDMVAPYGIEASAKREAPGVYVDGRKLASIGLRVRRGCSYHGMAFNIAMDLEPFNRINPCGYAGLDVTQLSALGGPDDLERVARELGVHLLDRFGYASAPEASAERSSARRAGVPTSNQRPA